MDRRGADGDHATMLSVERIRTDRLRVSRIPFRHEAAEAATVAPPAAGPGC